MSSVIKFLVSSLLSLFFIGTLIFAFFFYFTKIENVELKIDSNFKDFYFTKQIENKIVLKLKSYKGKKIWEVNLKNLVFEVKQIYPALKIQVARQLPNRIVVSLKNKEVAVLLLRDSGVLYSVSFQGDLQSRLPTYQSLDLPILRGKAFWKSKVLRQKAIQLLSQIPETGLLTPKNISEVIYNNKNSSFLFVLISNDLILESQKEISFKRINNINFVLNYLVQKNIKRSRVDARFDKKIIVNKHKSL